MVAATEGRGSALRSKASLGPQTQGGVRTARGARGRTPSPGPGSGHDDALTKHRASPASLNLRCAAPPDSLVWGPCAHPGGGMDGCLRRPRWLLRSLSCTRDPGSLPARRNPALRRSAAARNKGVTHSQLAPALPATLGRPPRWQPRRRRTRFWFTD